MRYVERIVREAKKGMGMDVVRGVWTRGDAAEGLDHTVRQCILATDMRQALAP